MLSYICFFFFNDTATTEIYTLSLHDALPISQIFLVSSPLRNMRAMSGYFFTRSMNFMVPMPYPRPSTASFPRRSEEHTSELQSPCNLVCRLLLEKKQSA